MFSQAEIRQEARTALLRARVPFPAFAGLMLLISAVLNLADTLCSGSTYEELFAAGPTGIFVFVLTSLIAMLMDAGRVAYCSAALDGERAEYGDLFCGFSFAFRFIAVMMLQGLLVGLGFSFFFVPGVILFYRYRFVLYVLCEDPSRSVTAILRQSSEELAGFKGELFLLDLSLLFPTLLSALPMVWWQFTPAEMLAGIPAPALVLIGSALSFPSLLMSFYRAAAELSFRRRILAYKYPGSADGIN